MNLTPEPFDMMARGIKTIELRLNDEKRRRIKIGDEIVFINTGDSGLKLLTSVVGLTRFDSFAALYQALPLLKCGYTEHDIFQAKPEDMDLYYPR